MEILNKELSEIINGYFSDKGGIGSDAYKKLRETIEGSDSLCAFLNDAASQGLFTAMQINTTQGSAATFGGKTLSINVSDILAMKKTTLAGVLAHEIQHGIDAPLLAANYESLEAIAKQIALQPGTKDYTGAARAYALGSALIEARAEIQAWNAVVDTLTQQNNGVLPTLHQIYESDLRAQTYIERRVVADDGNWSYSDGTTNYAYSLKGGVALDAQMKVSLRGGAEKLVNGLSDISASMGGASCPQTGAERHEKTPP